MTKGTSISRSFWEEARGGQQSTELRDQQSKLPGRESVGVFREPWLGQCCKGAENQRGRLRPGARLYRAVILHIIIQTTPRHATLKQEDR